MMKKNVIKIVSILLILGLVVALFSTYSHAAFDYTGKAKSMATATGNTSVNTSVSNATGAILTVTRVIAVGVAVVMLIVLAMKYMMAAPGDRADIKKHAVVYVVGAVILFASAGILGIIGNFANSAIT